jgi:hypothetical protein
VVADETTILRFRLVLEKAVKDLLAERRLMLKSVNKGDIR